MRACGYDAECGTVDYVVETQAAASGHPFNLEREDFQAVHHIGYAGGHEAEVFAARQEVGFARKDGQFLQGFVAPELLVAFIEVVVVQAAVGFLTGGRESLTGRSVVASEAGVPAVAVVVGEEKHVGAAFLLARDVQHFFVQSPVFDFFKAEGQGRGELSEKRTRGLVGRDLPDAEETQDVVDAIGIEIGGHVAETLSPPQIAVAGHALPIVGGELPVLPFLAECIGRGSGGCVKAEELRMLPSVHRVAVDAYGYVALDEHAALAGMAGGGQKLGVELVLQPEIVLRYGIVADKLLHGGG